MDIVDRLSKCGAWVPEMSLSRMLEVRLARKIGWLVALLCMMNLIGCGSSKVGFVPEEFVVPESYQEAGFLFKRLTTAYAALDYEAVMESRVRLRALFGGDWPPDSFKLEENHADLEEHDALFTARRSFTFTILNPDESRVLGCMYINPVEDPQYDAQVHLWVRTSELNHEPAIKTAARQWLLDEWPFSSVKYHGE